MELLLLEKGDKILVAHIVGERIHDVAEMVERNNHGRIFELTKDATLLVENPSKHDEGHFVVKHLRDAVAGRQIYDVPVIKNKVLRRSCDQHGLTPVHVPGGEYPLVSSPSAIIIADYNMSGSRHYVVDGEIKRKVFDFAFRIMQSRVKENLNNSKELLRKEIENACLYQQVLDEDLLANTIYMRQALYGSVFGTVIDTDTDIEGVVDEIASYIAKNLIPRHLKRGYRDEYKVLVDEANKFVYWTEN